jgi:hypothetical protein
MNGGGGYLVEFQARQADTLMRRQFRISSCFEDA